MDIVQIPWSMEFLLYCGPPATSHTRLCFSAAHTQDRLTRRAATVERNGLVPIRQRPRLCNHRSAKIGFKDLWSRPALYRALLSLDAYWSRHGFKSCKTLVAGWCVLGWRKLNHNNTRQKLCFIRMGFSLRPEPSQSILGFGPFFECWCLIT